MCEPARESSHENAVADELFAYRLVISDGPTETPLALCGSSAIAYAAYYAAQREYYGRGLTLRCGSRVLATSAVH